MYRLIIEYLLGMKQEGDKLSFVPCLPSEWNGFVLRYRYKKTSYHITVARAQEREKEMKVILDGIEQEEKSFFLTDDGMEHGVEIII
jgi:cellobiose phosphorylase